MVKIFSALFLCLLSSGVYAASITGTAGTAAFDFLKISQGARAVAMGDSYTGVSDDISALYWNQAGIAQNTAHTLAASHALWFDGISRYYVGYAMPSSRLGAFGASVNYVSVGGIEKRTGDTDTYSAASVWNMAAALAWAKSFSDRLSLGGGLKLIVENLDTEQENGIAVDLGGLYRVSGGTTLGLCLQNIGVQMPASGDADFPPVILRAGAARQFLGDKLLLASDGSYGLIDNSAYLTIGGEYRIGSVFRPRAGYKYRLNNTNLEGLSGAAAGFGLTYKNYRLDYAITPFGDLGITHRLDFTVTL
ncbi:MAG: hypothetical protein A2219_02540 [Elusimicrobia bacterium RIFOXYA2_FULL_50_26]|nr:MAG: hypothetical protein A2219_02540 [Elusimicrobia bacterium RIFOXYA2_FULL_50_26]